jgi:hypothetical protein
MWAVSYGLRIRFGVQFQGLTVGVYAPTSE